MYTLYMIQKWSAFSNQIPPYVLESTSSEKWRAELNHKALNIILFIHTLYAQFDMKYKFFRFV